MTPLRLLLTSIIPALADLASGGIPDSRQARVFLLAIAIQESGLRHRRQVTASGEEDGPAASWWQFEKGGGCKGVLTHPSVAKHMRWVCEQYTIEPTAEGLWEAIRYQDIAAACAARLLIYTLPSKLPETPSDGWAQYKAAWRPGKPRPETWAEAWSMAERVVGVGK